MNKWLIRSAIVTGSLGLIGAMIILFNTIREKGNNGIDKDKEETKHENVIDTSKTNIVRNINLSEQNADTNTTASDTDVSYVNTTNKKVIKDPEPIHDKKEDENLRHEIIAKPHADTLIKKTVAKKFVKKKIDEKITVAKGNLKQQQKQLTKAELKDLGLAINALKARNGNRLNCARLRFLENANNKVAATQVLKYLSKRKFAISGRETIASSRKGVYINSNGSCITVTLGSL